ncbi:MAG: two-component system response regulator BaeR [Desulfobacteraceae bacterium IS3]|nr:MAG: two-component system response regulator BaeR [Desulfobacteraceae bacterium IS3]
MTAEEILIVEDEVKIAQLLRDYLKKEGYSVTCMERGDTVIPYLRKKLPELILLDIMLPGKEGTEVCREIRKFSTVPIIMLTARADEVDRIVGLELGADDYICKPFSPREVMARIKAVLRRIHSPAEEKKIVAGPVTLDEITRRVTVLDQELKLTRNEFGLLRVMMLHPDRVFSRNELLNLVQGYDFEGYDRTIDTHVKNLRKKIADIIPDKEIISTVYGMGYKLSLS